MNKREAATTFDLTKIRNGMPVMNATIKPKGEGDIYPVTEVIAEGVRITITGVVAKIKVEKVDENGSALPGDLQK